MSATSSFWRAGLAALLFFTGPVMAQTSPRWAIAIHGGAGVIERERLSAEQERAYRQSLQQVITAGAGQLAAGASALDVVEATVGLLEDDPLFNAGRGAVFTAEGRNELDSSIMDGRTLQAGAVAGVRYTRHPISLARRVMEQSPHVLLMGDGADTFSREQQLEQVAPAWFYTEARWNSLLDFLRSRELPLPQKPAGVDACKGDCTSSLIHLEGKYGTVGVVVLDAAGNVAAGTSTGGTTGKRWGRVGDSPIIGAGTYASNTSCAVSATGTGEYFIRLSVAKEICSLVEHRGMTLQQATDDVVQRQLTAIGGDGGVIAVSPKGELGWSFNTSGMYRARAAAGQAIEVGIFKDDP